MAAKKKETPKVDPEKTEPTKDTSAKDIEALKKQVEEMGKFRDEATQAIRGADVLANTILGNPELTKKFQDEVAKQYPDMVQQGQTPGQQPKQDPAQTKTNPAPQPQDEVVKRVAGVEMSQREQVIGAFEEQHGISSMKEEERVEARRKIEGYLNDFGQSIATAPLPTLKKTLDKAYVGTHAEKLKEEGRLEGLVEGRTNARGTMGTISGTAPGTESDEGELTEAQAKWADKLKVDKKAAKETYAKREEEKDRVTLAEKKAEKAK